MMSQVSLESQQYYSAEEDLTGSESGSVVHLPVFDESRDKFDDFSQSSPISDKGTADNSLATTVLEETMKPDTSSSSTLSYESADSLNSV